ncbi:MULTISPECIES: hypothetical protein [Erwiniaceae]|jgi:hypothetical protein|uniref:C-type lysozyme inhibitor domain-containing protein n=2 Tax=Erwiniaceae TaxID=1903409 RepID=A0ABR8ZW70_9GAMM|nr:MULTISPECIES: hypothetical protein [Erwiniaceae]MBD8107574.1 hypothetical protein [Erwinia persicina]MBD8210654.1 hypothetical protein [Erwinia persicina]MCQ8226420.1 hypothetical protein [Pantoea sp. MMK2]MCQ8238340.1 hypothetical protein [Pantoea sp. MMK3]
MKVKIIASLAVFGSLLLSGCVTRYVQVPAPVAAPVEQAPASTVRIVNVSVCRFVATYDGKTYSTLPAVMLVTFSDGDQWVKLPNGNRFRVWDKEPLKNDQTMAYYIKSELKSGGYAVGSANHCK